MKNRILYTLWGVLFILCAGLGFIPEPQGLGKALLILAAAAFFVPGIWLTVRGAKQMDRKLLCLVRNLSLASLIATLVVLVTNFLLVTAPEWMGDLFFGLLVVVSTPMVCSQFWVGSMFVWACLLFVCLFRLKELPGEMPAPKHLTGSQKKKKKKN